MHARPATALDFRVRIATPGDVEAIAAVGKVIENLHRDARPESFDDVPDYGRFNASWRERIAGHGRRGWVAEVSEVRASDGERRIVGILTVHLLDRQHGHASLRMAYVNAVGVYGAHRRRGIATALMREAETWAKSNGACELRLDVWSFNADAVAFYEALGYRTRSVAMAKSFGGGIEG